MRIDYNLLYSASKLPVLKWLVPVATKVRMGPLTLLLRLILINVTYSMAGLVTNKNCDFQRDPEFVKAYQAAMKQHNMPDTDIWRYHINHWAAHQALKLEGDFVECGVNRGSTVMSNIVYTGFESVKDKRYYLFDTFNGLDRELSTPDEYSRGKNRYPDCYRFVVDSFKNYPNVVIVRGIVPQSLTQVHIDKVSYLSIDMNCASAEYEALKYFWPKLVKGGIVMLDDYGWPMCERQKEAADKFALSMGTMIMSLPNGQGLMIK